MRGREGWERGEENGKKGEGVEGNEGGGNGGWMGKDRMERDRMEWYGKRSKEGHSFNLCAHPNCTCQNIYTVQ